MQHRTLKMGVVAVGSIAATMVVAVPSAFADYAPVAKDVVGVGSDTVQYASDFIADGDPGGDLGFNSTGVKYRVINFDATPDANARLAYGPGGVGPGTCAPGNGTTAGTGNNTGTHADQPCTLNPTIVLRAGQSPVQRPNGSKGGALAGSLDSNHYISYVRASSPQEANLHPGGTDQGSWDSITIGQDPLAMLTGTTTNAPPLSAAQLNLIYSCTDTVWTQVGGTSGNTIIPILPQVGSGTRSSFLTAIGSPALGGCVKTAEENDPTAISAQAPNSADAIEPMSGGRLNMFLGLDGSGNPTGAGGYFKDPSCALNNIKGASPANCTGATLTLSPAVKLTTTGTPSDSQALFDVSRPLFIYFRDTDVSSATAFEPGGTLNFVKTLFYNPCPDNPPIAGDGCTTKVVAGNSVNFGPGGAPFYATPGGQALVSAAGITPTYAATVGGP
jgi:ABC-type phosphate transport system substrate-binding protein